MANYKIALKLYQSQVGDENAEVKISVNGTIVADNVEVSNSNSEAPTLFVYDVTDLPSAGADITTTVKVEILNDLYVDSNNDRNVYWTGCGYAAENDDGNYYYTWAVDELAAWPCGGVTDWTDDASFNWVEASEYQGDENGTVDMSIGWHTLAITSNYVSATISLTFPEIPPPVNPGAED
jgi:hypothetical protein